MSLYWVMVVPLVIQVVGAVAVVGWLSHRNGQQAVNAVAIQLRSESSSRIQQHLDSYLSLPMQLNRVNVDAVELGLLDLQNFQQTGQYFWRQMQTFMSDTSAMPRRLGILLGWNGWIMAAS